MNGNTQNAWLRATLALTGACLLGLLAYATLAGLSTAAADDVPDRVDCGLPPMLLDSTDAYTSYIPIVMRMCEHRSDRTPLQGTANFGGDVKIGTPANCTKGVEAEKRVDAIGTYSGTPANTVVWVLAYSPEGLYYPQSPHAPTGDPPYQVGGYWQVPMYLGEKGGPPEWFDIVAIVTDETTSQFLSDWLIEGYQNGDYQGISESLLNQMGITEKDAIVVQTTD